MGGGDPGLCPSHTLGGEDLSPSPVPAPTPLSPQAPGSGASSPRDSWCPPGPPGSTASGRGCRPRCRSSRRPTPGPQTAASSSSAVSAPGRGWPGSGVPGGKSARLPSLPAGPQFWVFQDRRLEGAARPLTELGLPPGEAVDAVFSWPQNGKTYLIDPLHLYVVIRLLSFLQQPVSQPRLPRGHPRSRALSSVMALLGHFPLPLCKHRPRGGASSELERDPGVVQSSLSGCQLTSAAALLSVVGSRPPTDPCSCVDSRGGGALPGGLDETALCVQLSDERRFPLLVLS